jgi:hypothetical protein
MPNYLISNKNLWNELFRLPFLRYFTPGKVVSKDMTLHRITELCTELLSVCSNLNSKLRTIAMFKTFMKQKKRLVGMFMILYCKKNVICLGAAVHEFFSTKQNINFNFLLPSMFSFSPQK